LAGLRLLVLEDNTDSRELMAEVLSAAGAIVGEAASVREAWQLIDAQLPDLILSDIALPEEDGYSFMRALRSRTYQEGGAIPAIAVTAYSTELGRSRAERSGFTELVGKPITSSEIVELVARIARRQGS
jgi:CheY-like chemotaxis protein